MFTFFTLKSQLVISMVVALIFVCILAAFIYLKSNELSTLTTNAYHHPFTVSNAVRDANNNVISMHRYMKDVALATNRDQMRHAIQLVKKNENRVFENFEVIRERFLGDISQVDDAVNAIKDSVVIRDRVIHLMQAGKKQEAAAITKNEGAKQVELIEQKMQGLLTFANNKATEFVAASQTTVKTILFQMLGILLAIYFIGMSIGYNILQGIRRQIASLKSDSQAIILGDYSTPVTDLGANEIGELSRHFEQMRISIHHSISEIRLTRDKVLHANKTIQSEQQFTKYLLDTAQAIILVLNTDGCVVQFNSYMEGLSGYSLAEVKGKDWFTTFLPNDDQEKIHAIFRDTLIETVISCHINPIVSKSGEEHQIEWHNKVLRDDADNAIGVISIGINITEQKKNELALIESQKTAELAISAKEEFLANVSHELRSPIHGILGFASLGVERSEKLTKEKLTQYLGNIKISADKLLLIINDLLDLSKLKSGRMDISCSRNSLMEIAQACVSEQQARLSEINTAVIFHPECTPGIGEFDPDRISQVITNILSNAIKFTPEGKSIEILVSEKTIQDLNSKDVPALLFSIRDYGDGIPEDELELIFEKFQQSSTNKNKKQGTGLGLPICNEIITLHAGEIWAENHPDGGALFAFKIPAEHES